MKVLNLYACLGGNRLLWDNCEVTAVELDPELARMYQERFPDDNVLVTDAHQYLLDHYQEYDFIWSSPPCPTHSRARYWSSSNYDTSTKPVYPDLRLYEEILFLQHYYKTGRYVVENVIPYYEPLIPAQKRGRHLYWTNFNLPSDLGDRPIQIAAGKDEHKRLEAFHGIKCKANIGGYRDVLRNLVDYEAGKTIFHTARGIITHSRDNQHRLFGDSE